ncbi:MAG: UbiA family prenyltransferase [Deltaproteobacteria bacterium]|nr:UbiA family prenyltransferase [Deltaproteobacteria bacterium]
MMNNSLVFRAYAKVKWKRGVVLNWFYLTKPLLSFFIAVSALFGFLIIDPVINSSALLTFISIYLLSSGAAVFNNIQDRDYDVNYSRTSHRVLPQNKVAISSAFFWGLFLTIISLSLVFNNFQRYDILVWSLISLVLYNLIYTPLKKKNILAIIPGAACGSLPPYLGWLMAGGSGFSTTIFFIMIWMAIWQLPHFWLILIRNQAEYKKGKHKNLFRIFDIQQINRITITWINAYLGLSLLFPLYFSLQFQFAFYGLYIETFLAFAYFNVAYLKQMFNQKRSFLVINVHLFLVILIIASDLLFR